MSKYLLSVAVVIGLASCGGSPFDAQVDEGGGDGDGTTLPGTENPTAQSAITRYEPEDGSGSGYVRSVSYNDGDDTFTVDNLAFDGDNTYNRDTANLVQDLGPFKVYEGPETAPDALTGAPIQQFLHRAIYGVSASGATEFSIVRTGSYVDYGFGGFVFKRNGGVVMPTTGQAAYNGQYAALRDFQGRAAIEYALGNMSMDIDFNDFNQGDAVRAEVTGRRILDVNGADITDDVLRALETKGDLPKNSLIALPTLQIKVGPGMINDKGEINGEAISNVLDAEGVAQEYETGKFYAVLSGDHTQYDTANGLNGGEVVGVIVVTAEDPRYENVTVRETGGFILNRTAP